MTPDLNEPTRAEMLRAERRLGLTAVGEEHLGEILLGRLKVSWPDLPEDAVFYGAHLDPASMSIKLLWGHESFMVSTPGYALPVVDINATLEWLEPEETEE